MTSVSAVWAELATTMRACTACPELAATRTNVVVGVAPPGARVLLVGEAPGATEDAEGVPFVGRAGRLLDTLLAGAGLPRETVAVANVLKCRPPGNRKPTRTEVGNCRGFLDAQVEAADPQVVCTMGTTAAEWAFGPSARIGKLRGQPHCVDGHTVVVTYHPSAALRFGPRGAPMTALRDDLALVARLVSSRETSGGSA